MPRIGRDSNEKYKRLLIAKINYYCDVRGVTKEHQRVIVRCSTSTLCRRFKNPGTFTLDELIRLANKLNIPIWELLKPNDK